eukprot:TRINITY_DN92600_c0_g1_i1.p1 TRINITY_DN92600_c0_g1~~TRINITY_DN92600_c0_g1_i1.p1  ORF type:complete len:942 (+),score=159.03 TRINITY_DN92600_c0_g1_i1:112-2937(+)
MSPALTGLWLLTLAAVQAALASGLISAHHAQLEGMSTARLEDHVMKLLKTKATPGLAKTINVIKELIDGFYPKINQSHESDLQALADAKAGWNLCETLALNDSHVRNLSQQHQDCREQEAGYKKQMDYWCGLLPLRAKDYLSKCGLFEKTNKLDDLVPDACQKNDGESNEGAGTRVANYWKDMIAEWWEDYYDCSNATNISQWTNWSCANFTQKWLSERPRCDAIQRQMDNAQCTLNLTETTNCEDFSNCWNNANGTFIRVNASTYKNSIGRASEWRALKRMDCILDALLLSDAERADGIETCRLKNYSYEQFILAPVYYIDWEPKMPVESSCPWYLRPGNKLWKEQEYDILPEDAPAAECEAECCRFCQYYPYCVDNLVVPNAASIEAFDASTCCDSAHWEAAPWPPLPNCSRECGTAAVSISRSVWCQNSFDINQSDQLCEDSPGLKKPIGSKQVCEATSECAVCTDNCSVGEYKHGCGGYYHGICHPCAPIADNRYYTGDGGFDDACPSVECTGASCSAGTYLDGCGKLSAGTCTACSQECPNGMYFHGCGALSPGTCSNCAAVDGQVFISSGVEDPTSCQTVPAAVSSFTVPDSFNKEQIFPPASWSDPNFNDGLADRVSLSLLGRRAKVTHGNNSVDMSVASRMRQSTSGDNLAWVELTERCQDSTASTGNITLGLHVIAGVDYMLEVEAAWRPKSGRGVKGIENCNDPAYISALQMHAEGVGGISPTTAAVVDACFDRLHYHDWKKVYFNVNALQDDVNVTLFESVYSCIVIKSVSIFTASCGAYQCPPGYTNKGAASEGADTISCCDPVPCPANSEGVKSANLAFVPEGCRCITHYGGEIRPSDVAPYYTGSCSKSCELFDCPAGTRPLGDTKIGKTQSECCAVVGCPANSAGPSVYLGCTCTAGFTGIIAPSSTGPLYYEGACEATTSTNLTT